MASHDLSVHQITVAQCSVLALSGTLDLILHTPAHRLFMLVMDQMLGSANGALELSCCDRCQPARVKDELYR